MRQWSMFIRPLETLRSSLTPTFQFRLVSVKRTLHWVIGIRGHFRIARPQTIEFALLSSAALLSFKIRDARPSLCLRAGPKCCEPRNQVHLLGVFRCGQLECQATLAGEHKPVT
jgi:hypothetical protein